MTAYVSSKMLMSCIRNLHFLFIIIMHVTLEAPDGSKRAIELGLKSHHLLNSGQVLTTWRVECMAMAESVAQL